jgi:lysophospholipase L1-like esterase
MSIQAVERSELDVRVERPRRSCRALALCVVVIAVVSLAGNVVAVQAALGIYAREQEVRLDPLGLRYHVAERASASASMTKPRLILYGDSRVAMWTPAPSVPGWDIVNLGVGFQTTTQALLRFDYDAAPFHPTVVVFEVGVNDLKDLATFSDRRDAIVRDCEENIAALVTKARALGAEVVLATVFDLGDAAIWRTPFWTPAPIARAIAEVNTFIRSQARDGVVVIEAAPILDDARGKIRASYQADHLHLVPAAYAALNEKVVSIVSAFPPGPR